MDILWLIGAYGLGMVASQAGLPPLVGYLGAGLALSYSEFALIVGAIAVDVGVLSEATLIVVTLAALGSFAVNALVNRWAGAAYGRLEPWLVGFERTGPHPDDQPRSLGSGQVLIVGMGRVGAAAYDALREREVRLGGRGRRRRDAQGSRLHGRDQRPRDPRRRRRTPAGGGREHHLPSPGADGDRARGEESRAARGLTVST